MEKKDIDLELDYNNMHYTGWATPSSKKKDNGQPASYHVVLNDVYFGNVSHDGQGWTVDEQRPQIITDAVGAIIEKVHKP